MPRCRPEESADQPAAAADFAVALVYPPFGPFGVASLGLSILSAGLKDVGIECKTFYWNIDFLKAMPFRDSKALYANFSCQFLFPTNEWVFSGILYPDGPVTSKEEMGRLFLREKEELPSSRRQRYWRVASYLFDHAADYVDRMADQLEPFAVVGINTTFFQNIPALALARTVKQRWPDKIVVLGGANCNGALGTTLIEQFDFLDIVFLGEADLTFPQLVQKLARGESFADIEGIAYRAGGRLIVNEKAEPITDLDVTPRPDFDDYVAQYRAAGVQDQDQILLPLESSRGCWWGLKKHCTFCGLNAENLAMRQKSWDRFRDEVEETSAKYGVSYFFMTDNIFTWKLLDRFAEWNGSKPKPINFFYEIRPTAKREQVLKLIEAGITMVQPGIEHFSTKILTMIEKHLVGINNIAFLKYAREYGLRPAYNIICMFPGEEADEYSRLADDLPKLTHLMPPNGLNPVQYHRFSPYYYHPEKYGIKLEPYWGYRYLYPFETEVLQDLAYLFDLSEPLEHPAGAHHLAGINKVVNDWRDAHLEDWCPLTWSIDGEEILIEDRRPAFPRRTFRLQREARAIFHALDAPLPLDAAVRRVQADAASEPWRAFRQSFSAIPERGSRNGPDNELVAEFFAELLSSGPERVGEDPEEVVISFSAEELDMDPLAAIGPLAEAGLVYEEDGRYLALPVYEGRRRTDPAWQLFDV